MQRKASRSDVSHFEHLPQAEILRRVLVRMVQIFPRTGLWKNAVLTHYQQKAFYNPDAQKAPGPRPHDSPGQGSSSPQSQRKSPANARAGSSAVRPALGSTDQRPPRRCHLQTATYSPAARRWNAPRCLRNTGAPSWEPMGITSSEKGHGRQTQENEAVKRLKLIKWL